MLKWAAVFLVLMIAAGILGFVVDVAGGIAKLLFFVFLIGFAITAAGRWLRRGAG